MSPRQSRHKLLLDEMFPRREKFPELNNYHDLKHAIHDFRLKNNQDKYVVELAAKENRILISRNKKHMVDLCKQHDVLLICVTETMNYESIDSQIMSRLRIISKNDGVISLSKPKRKSK